MKRLIPALLLVAMCCALPAAAEFNADDFNATGIWESSYLFSSIRVQVTEHNGEEVRGVAYVTGPLGGVDVYHFEGTVKGKELKAIHKPTGHRFEGKVVDDDHAEGVVITAKKHHHLSMEATRKH